ncbi:MAG TPA: transglutaminase family protein [Devosia sp.]|nr:transglutaminase family protein [Devosia sp.]
MDVFRVMHRTVYSYRRPVGFGEHRLLFRPRDSYDQHLRTTRLCITPEPSDLFWIHDVFGNCLAIARFEAEAEQLEIETEIVLEHDFEHGPRFRTLPEAKAWPLIYDAQTLPDLEPVLRRHYPDDGVVEVWARRFLTAPAAIDETGHILMTMTAAIKDSFRYVRRNDPGTQTPQVTLALGSGTCRDFALLMIEAARSLGFAARFITGYIYVPSRDRDEIRGGGATHAWVQVFLPGAGWVEFDPTNGIIGSRDLIRVGVARDPSQARPLSGSFRGERSDYLGMTVEVKVTREREAQPA